MQQVLSPLCAITKELSEEHRTIHCVADLRCEQEWPHLALSYSRDIHNCILSLQNNLNSICIKSRYDAFRNLGRVRLPSKEETLDA
jgi:hypothetical protein